MYKALLHETWTKRDISGNVYHTVKITNPKTRNSFTVSTCSIGNVEHILNSIFTDVSKTYYCPWYITDSCTGSSRLSSLPDSIYLDECHRSIQWEKELRKIGYRIPKQ